MKLIYIFISHFRNIINQKISFSDRYAITFVDGRLTINEHPVDGVKDAIFGNKLIKDLSIIVGKTGSGKTNILQLIGMDQYSRIEEDSAYFLLYKSVEDTFMLESYNMVVNDIVTSAETTLTAYKFRCDIANKIISNVGKLSGAEMSNTYIINSFDRNAFTSCPIDDVHDEGCFNDRDALTRRQMTYERANANIVCEYVKKYITRFPAESVKRKASLVIRTENWQYELENELEPKLKRREYWTYAEEKYESTFHHKKKNRNRPEASPKMKFIHDLLMDYAIYMRKWVDALLTDEARIKDMLQDYYFPYTPMLPDGKKMNISKRILHLGQVIDFLSDGNPKGLVWQIADDIKDIGTTLYKFDDKYFTDDKFEIPVTEIDDQPDGIFEELMERMNQYRPDEIGVFTKELLPYTFTYLSSGEYQYTKIFGLVDEFCNRVKYMRAGQKYKDARHPNFIFLMDEPENFMHPEMCRNFIKEMSDILGRHNADSEIQIIMATHSPFMLSDVLTSQVIKVDFNEFGYCQISQNSNKEYFAANIFTILSDSFFLDYTIGENARQFLSDGFQKLRFIVEHKETINEVHLKEIEDIRMILPHIGDKLIRYSFESLLKQLP